MLADRMRVLLCPEVAAVDIENILTSVYRMQCKEMQNYIHS